MSFEAIADAQVIRRRFDPQRARSRVAERQLLAPINERSMFQRGDAMDTARMPNVKMGRDSKEYVSRIVNNDLDHILNGLIDIIDRAYCVRVRVHAFDGTTQRWRCLRDRWCIDQGRREFGDLTWLA